MTADQLKAQTSGYRIEHGGPADGELEGRYWWTLTRPGWSGIDASPDEFDTAEDAWADAVRAHKEEIARGEPGA